MEKVGNNISDSRLKSRPYTIPEGYCESLESRVSERIGTEEAGGRAWSVIKPAALLTFMFALIFGIGYATLSLTGTLGDKGQSALADNESILESAEMDEDVSNDIIEYLAENLTLEDIHTYATEDMPNSGN